MERVSVLFVAFEILLRITSLPPSIRRMVFIDITQQWHTLNLSNTVLMEMETESARRSERDIGGGGRSVRFLLWYRTEKFFAHPTHSSEREQVQSKHSRKQCKEKWNDKKNPKRLVFVVRSIVVCVCGYPSHQKSNSVLINRTPGDSRRAHIERIRFNFHFCILFRSSILSIFSLCLPSISCALQTRDNNGTLHITHTCTPTRWWLLSTKP